MRTLGFALLAVLLLAASPAAAETERYFAVWSYTLNEPLDEISVDALEDRKLGYWKVMFDDEGGVVSATYHGATGARWLSFTYVEQGDRIFADLYGPDGEFIRRKSTSLTSRIPPPDVAGR